jgi:hypothetical protein
MIEACRLDGSSLSERAKARMEQARGGWLLVADWDEVLMIHFAVDAKQLQSDVHFELDIREGWAFVTLASGIHDARNVCGLRRSTDFVAVPTDGYARFSQRANIYPRGQ